MVCNEFHWIVGPLHEPGERMHDADLTDEARRRLPSLYAHAPLDGTGAEREQSVEFLGGTDRALLVEDVLQGDPRRLRYPRPYGPSTFPNSNQLLQ